MEEDEKKKKYEHKGIFNLDFRYHSYRDEEEKKNTWKRHFNIWSCNYINYPDNSLFYQTYEMSKRV